MSLTSILGTTRRLTPGATELRSGSGFNRDHSGKTQAMITTGVVVLIIGLVLSIPVLVTVGAILVLVGLAIILLGSMGRAVGGRRHYW